MKTHIAGRFFTIFYAVMVMALFVGGAFMPDAAAQQTGNPQAPYTPPQAMPDIHKSVSELSDALLNELGGIPADRGPLQAPMAPAQNEQSVPQLYSAYATIRGYLMAPNAKDSFESFTKLCTDFPRHCMFISEFWRVRALKDCLEFNNYVFDVLITGSNPEQRGYFESMIEQCSYGYYYDHWDEMNDSIKNALAKAKAEKEAKAAPQKK